MYFLHTLLAVQLLSVLVTTEAQTRQNLSEKKI